MVGYQHLTYQVESHTLVGRYEHLTYQDGFHALAVGIQHLSYQESLRTLAMGLPAPDAPRKFLYAIGGGSII